MELALQELKIWAVDCQATGATPAAGHLLELAWWGPDEQAAWSSLVALPEGARLPRPVSEVTGIRRAMLAGAPTYEDVSASFLAELERVRAADGALVAHFARYERGWLTAMAGEQALPPLVCTHEMARRLLPQLPKRGLRAIAGYFGQEAVEAKRAGEHVEATRLVWRELVGLLAEQEGITRLDELTDWLARPAPRGVKRALPLPDAVRLGLPQAPGVYRMCGKGGQVLYVGKATNLKERVNSYYRGKRGQGDRKLELVVQVWSLDVTVCRTPLEAALWETREIQRLDPPYNQQQRAWGRPLVWLDPADWTSQRHAPDAQHTLGPVGWLWVPRAIRLWTRLLAGDAAAADEADWAPAALLREGAALAFVRLGLTPCADGRAATAQLEAAMAQVVAARAAAQLAEVSEVEAPDEDAAEEVTPTEQRGWSWTPEAVADVVEETLAQLARQLEHISARRALWGRRVAYTWRGVEGAVEAGPGRLRVYGEQGAAQEIGPLAASWDEMDAASWDLLGVLASELGRLSSGLS